MPTPNPQSLGVAGLVDSGVPEAGQSFDVEFYSLPACDAVGPTTLLGTGQNFVTNETGIAGFAKDGLTDVDVGTAVIAVTTRGETTSPRSNCVVADRNNTSWHTAFELTPTDTETGALRASGQPRWFKVPILPNSRVDVSLSNLPADYDLIVFSDIQQAYQRLVGSNVNPSVGPNLAITDLQREGAETQNDVFNTSQYDSSTWDPTNWDPNLNNAVFSPSEWSPSEWSPSEWSASSLHPVRVVAVRVVTVGVVTVGVVTVGVVTVASGARRSGRRPSGRARTRPTRGRSPPRRPRACWPFPRVRARETRPCP